MIFLIPGSMPGAGLRVLMTGVLLVSGCATMSPEECAVADWERLGQRDARAGLSPEYFARRAGDCSEAGYSADQVAWMRGWDHGIVDFCTPHTGYRKGLEGYSYEYICPRDLESDFLHGYETGLAIHEAESRLEQTENRIESAEERLAELNNAEPPDREAIGRARKRLKDLQEQRHGDELDLERLRGVAEGRGYRY